MSEMGDADVTMASSGLLPKITSLFNNPLYSDIQFIFINQDGKDERIYCHKLILALQSKAFDDQFFRQEESPTVMKMKAEKKDLFYLLFKFLYTGEVQFRTFGEARDLYELANDLGVEELANKCYCYMLEGNLTFANLFSRYEHALGKQLNALLRDCRNFVCSNVKIILESENFMDASSEVVEDIVKLDNLPLSTELEIIRAVLDWGARSLSRNEVPYSEMNLRKAIDPFLKHLRILSLTSAEFQYLIELHDNLFSAIEIMLLTQKIMIPESDIKLPENFSYITTKRGTAAISRVTSTKYQQNNSVKPNSPKSVHPEPPKSHIYPQSGNNKLGYEVRKYSSKYGNTSSGQKPRFNSSPNIVRNVEFPVPNFSQSFLRDFQFPLAKCEKSFQLSFRKDIKSSVVMKMKSGNLSLHGFELKVKNKKEKEELEVSVDLEGFSKQRFSKSYKMELKNDILSVTFPKPMKLLEGCKATLEVHIEDLFLDRCSQIGKKQYELNSGLNFECQFSVDSNKKTDDDCFLFLISKLLYVPC